MTWVRIPWLVAIIMAPAAAHAEAPNLASVVRVACAGLTDAKEEREVPPERIAEAILFQAGVPASRLMNGRTFDPRGYREALLSAVRNPPPDLDAATREMIGQYVLTLGQDLSPGSTVSAKARGLRLLSPPPATLPRGWIFDPKAGVRIACMPVKPPSATPVLDVYAAGNGLPLIGLTKTIQGLSAAGNDRKTADSATIGLKIARTVDDDGSSKRTTTLTFDGTLGLRLTSTHASTAGFLFANYTLSRDRTRPAAPLDPGKRVDDKDTNGLEIGVTAGDIALPLDLSVGATGGYIFDYAKDSQRATGSILLDSGYTPNLGLCKLGMLKAVTLAGVDFRTECTLQLEAITAMCSAPGARCSRIAETFWPLASSSTSRSRRLSSRNRASSRM